ncbi:MAG: DUF1579 domain-containing protein [Caldithrix sp.]|nr:DUF1579 domain-containing protein [Caldithrix sp.]
MRLNHLLVLTISFMILNAFNLYSQDSTQVEQPCASEAADQFDFWLGEWKLTWPAEQFGGQEGKVGHGKNTVTKILDGCVIREQFSFPANNFYGRSVTVYNPGKMIWKQTWVDNKGGYLSFTGRFADEKMILKTKPRKQKDKTIISRMVFRNIKPNSFDWDWQRSLDGGETWKNLWNIHYERIH